MDRRARTRDTGSEAPALPRKGSPRRVKPVAAPSSGRAPESRGGKGRLELPAGGATVAEGGAEAPATHRSMTRERTAKDSAAGAPRGTSSSNFASSNFAYLSYH